MHFKYFFINIQVCLLKCEPYLSNKIIGVSNSLMHLSLLLENTCATGIITRLVHCNTDFMGLLFFCISSICQNLQACLRMQDALMEH